MSLGTDCFVTVTVEIGNSKITLAVDVSEEGKVLLAKVIAGSVSGADDILSAFAGKNYDEISAIAQNSDAAALLKGAVLDAISAFKCYTDATENGEVFVANTNSKKFHKESCSGATSMSEANKLVYIGFAADLIEAGYAACGICNPAN